MYHNGVMTSGTRTEDWELSEMQYLTLAVCVCVCVHDIKE